MARAYAATELPKRSPEVEAFIDWVCPKTRDRAVDVASGPATIARFMARRVRFACALDLSHAMLCQAIPSAKSARNLLLTAGNVERLPFRDASFDLVTCAYSFAVFRDLPLVLRECARVMKPAGRMGLIDVVAPEDPHKCACLNRLEAMRSDFHTRIPTYSECLQFFRNSGLTVVSSRSRRAPQKMTDWLRLSPVAADACRARELRQALLDSISGDQAGLHPRREGREVHFEYQTAWFLLRRGSDA